MYHHIRGTVVRLGPGEAIIEAGGVGYRVEIAFPAYKALESLIGQEALVFVLPYFREESQRMFGFVREQDREFFRLLLGVRGVGPALALSLLSGLTLAEIHQAITAEKPEILVRVRGVGRRTAERMILELREKLPPPGGAPSSDASDETETARLALQGLGYSRGDAVAAVEKAVRELPGENAAELIKQALRSR